MSDEEGIAVYDAVGRESFTKEELSKQTGCLGVEDSRQEEQSEQRL